MIDRGALARQLYVDEGERLRVYADSLGKLTAGVGHLLAPGSPVSQCQSDLWLEADMERALFACTVVFPRFATLPDEAQSILANMMFNLGLRGFSRFVGLIAAVDVGRWQQAADAMGDSLWARQVGARADRLIARMRKVES